MQQPGVFRTTARLAVLVVGVFALLALGAGEAFAQVTGKVVGIVTDSDTGAPLVGAQVVVDGTNLGNVTNEDGSYFITNVPVGIQNFTAQYLGYQTRTEQKRILAGQTMDVPFAMASEVVEVGPVVAVIEREPLVVRDNTISKTRFTHEETQGLPVKSIDDVVNLSAGIYQDEGRGGFVIRGGRESESATYVDGALVTSFASQNNVTELGTFAVEEVDVVTGGFNAEFGHAQSGIVNIVTREGGREFHGNVRYATDGQFGTDGYTSAELANADFNAGGLEEEKCCGFNSLQASIGGPIIPDKLTFFASADVTGAADFDPRAAGFNPALGQINSGGSTDNILPGARGDETRAQAKLTSFLTETSKVTGTYVYSRDQFENFQLSRGIDQHLSFDAVRQKTHDIIVGYDQEIFQTAERNLNVQVRGNFHQEKEFQGTPVSPELAAEILGGFPACGAECDIADDSFEDDFLNYRIDDIEFFFEDIDPAGLPEIANATAKSNNPDRVFGQPNVFITEGLGNSFNFQDERRYGVRVDLDTQLNRVHRGKAGVEWNWINILNRGSRYTDPQFADFYDVDPRIGAAYVQDRLDYGDLVIDLGLRWDHFNPNQIFPLFAGVVNCDITAFAGLCEEDALVADGEKRNEFSPRLGVAHPITDATQVRLSYGKFHQLPELQHYYSSFSTDFTAALNNPNITYGNPNLDYIETTAFEAGITHLISENLVLDVVAYNRDRRGAIRVDVFQPGSIDLSVGERRIFVNADNGNVKGFDLTVSKRYSSYFSTDLAWSLQWARGTTSSPLDFATGTGFGRLFDPLFPGRLLVPPTEILPEDFDRLHSINWQFQLRFPGEFREGTTVGTLLNDFGAYLVYNAHSGEPFTRVTRLGQGDPLEDIGSSRLPWVHQGDVRFTKGLDLGGALDLELFATVINFLDIENVVRVNETTGRAERTGFEFDRSRQPVISPEFQITCATGQTTGCSDGAFPFVLATEIGDDFRSELSRQDLNGDGTITLEESQESLFQALVASGEAGNFQGAVFGDSPFNYGEPRQFRFGAEIRF